MELRLVVTVETTENREGGSQAVQASLRSVRAGSVPQRSSTGMGGHRRSPTVRRNRRSRALRLKQLGRRRREIQIVVPKVGLKAALRTAASRCPITALL
jgi:hypothetical protein